MNPCQKINISADFSPPVEQWLARWRVIIAFCKEVFADPQTPQTVKLLAKLIINDAEGKDDR